MNSHNNEKWLEPLKNRPGLEPNPIFVRELKNSLMQGAQENNKKRNSFGRYRMWIPATFAIVLFSVLTVSLLTEQNQLQSPGGEENVPEVTNQVPEDTEKGNPDFDVLVTEYPSYKSIYNDVYQITKAEEASKQVVNFFEALRVENKDFMKKYVFFAANPEKEIPVLLDYYKGLDVHSLKVEYIVPSQAEPSFEIVFSYVQNKEEKTNHIHLNFTDESNFDIYAPVDEFDAEANWQNAISTKIVEIERKMEYGITQEEAVERFGPGYIEKKASGEGITSVWNYSYFATYDYIERNIIPNVKDLELGKVGVVLNIGWSPQGKATSLTMYYGRKGIAFVKMVDKDGISEKELTTGGDSYDDLELNDKEREAYESFKQDYDPEVLKLMDPISIAKMYIQASIERDWETEYELYTKREDRVRWSKQEHKEIVEAEKTSPEKVKEAFSGLGAGTFNQTSNFEGYISFVNKNGEQGFQMVKDENGVWKVSFMPIQ